MRGKFITIEGSEGAGKTTAISAIRNILEKARVPFIVTREPGGTQLGEALRALLLDIENVTICDDTELLLMFAARAQHLQEKIHPALAAGEWVICDRFTDATYAYQGGGRGIGLQRIEQLENWVQGDFRPDLTLLLDLPVKLGLQRVTGRGELDRFEKEQTEFFEKVRSMYLHRADLFPQQFRIIDAEQSVDGVLQQLKHVLEEYIKIVKQQPE